MGIATAAVYADQDRDAAHVRDADVAVALGGRSAAETYLDVEKLIAAAKRCIQGMAFWRRMRDSRAR
jgi:acetyl/propionyl-CoA carboxylase alpha subunit